MLRCYQVRTFRKDRDNLVQKIHAGKLSANGKHFAIVVSRFNDLVTTRLRDGALDCLNRHGSDQDAVEIAWVPGAFELPVVAQKLAKTGRFDVVICLGAIIRSDTPHFDYVAGEASKGIARVSLDTGIPITFGIITAASVDQAIQRAGVKTGNRGWDAAMNAIEMASLMSSIE